MPFQPDQISADHIKAAVKKIESEHLPLKKIKGYEVIIDGRPYPPKDIMRYAHQEMNGEFVWNIGGGAPTNSYFERLGFTTRSVKLNGDSDPIIRLIDDYKKRIKSTKLINEHYKWKLIKQFKGRPDLQASDFAAELKSIDYRNLIYPMGIAVMHLLAENKPTEYKQCLQDLFDETAPLKNRINSFISTTLQLYRDTGEGTLSHHHDERTCATLLAYHNPDYYALYKNSFYQKYCKLIGEQPRKKGEKYVHYLQLLQDLIDDYLVDDTELLQLVNDSLPKDAYDDSSHKILAQDIPYQMLDLQDKNSTKYWRIGSSDQDGNNYWNVMKDKHYIAIGWSDIGDLDATEVNSRTDVEKLLRDKGYYPTNNSVLSRKAGEIFDLYNNIKLNDVVVVQEGAKVLGIGVVKDEYSFEPGEVFSHVRPTEWKVIEPENLKSNEGNQTTVYQIKEPSFISAIQRLLKSTDPLTMTQYHSKNVILYGPPGTGKTYSSIDWAVKFIDGQSASDHNDNKKRFNELRKSGQVEFITFHQNYSYEDLIVGITPDVQSGELRFDKREGIFKELNDRARKNWQQSLNTEITPIDFETVFNSFFTRLIQEEVQGIDIPMAKNSFTVTKIDAEDGRIKFRKQSGGTGHDLLIKNVKGIYEETMDYREDGLGIYYKPLVKMLRQHAETLRQDQPATTLQNYVLIIDEINRANISKVFGELITLLEEDKRLGEKNELRVRLPNGDTDFGIPPNLYILGTMNTADKSISLIDVALRRRFEFIGMYPQYGKDLETSKAVLLKHINDAIFKEKGSADFLVGHAYFMNNLPIEKILINKIIPLLSEYFSGRIEIVKKIFTNSGFKVDYNIDSYSWEVIKQ